MATGDYTHGEMNVEAQEAMYDGTMRAGMWGALIILLGLAYSVFVLSIGMNWMVALGVCVAGALAIGFGMGLGAAWVVTVIGLAGLAVFIQILVILASAAL